MVFIRSGRGGYPGFGRGGGIQPTRDQVTPARRRRSLSPTQFRFLYPATPLAVPGARSTQQSNQQQTPQRSTVPETTIQSPATTIQSPATTSTIQPQGSTPVVSTPQVTQYIDPTQLSTAMLYQSKPLTPQQQALLSQLPKTQSSLIGPTQNAAISNTAIPSQLATLTAPMRPMDVAKEWYLDYVSPQSIKFYNKVVEALPGEKFNGTMIHTWLQVLTDRAYNCAWDSIITINGRLLTQHYCEITPAEVRAHAQAYQNEGSRRAQNAEMLMQLKASISKTVYSRISHLESKWTITRESDKRTVFDGVCYLKTIIDCYHVNTRSSTAEVRIKLAQLHLYMRHTAKGDVVQLCVYTRDLLAKLRAAVEDTKDLLTNLIAALRQSSSSDFLR